MADLISMLAGASGIGAEEADPNFNQTVLLLHGDGTNGAQNNTFLDSSTNNFTITRNGNTTQGTFSPFSVADGQWSNYFDGSGDYLTVPAGSAFAYGTDDFTVEGWFYATATPPAFGALLFAQTQSGTNYFLVLLGDNNSPAAQKVSFTFAVSGGGTTVSSGATLYALNTWNHFAVVRSSGSVKCYLNGVGGTAVACTQNFNNTTYVPTIGTYSHTQDQLFTGYLSNLRVVKGTAVYTSNFTPPTLAPLAISGSASAAAYPSTTNVDTSFASSATSLLTCQSNRFVDNSTANSGTGFAITRNGDVRVTPFSPFAPSAAYDPAVNGGSGYFDGTGDYLSIADAAGLRFGTGNFTIQAWIYRSVAGAVHSIAAKGGASTGWVFQVHSDNKLRFTQTTTNIDSTGTIPAGAWTHVAVVREGTGTNQTKLYINGVNDGQATVTTDFDQTEQLNIGADRGNANPMNGYIAGFKYVVGTAETITVPTAPPTGGTALLNFTNAGILDNTGKNNLETVGDAQIDTTTKKFGTGSMEFDGTGDWLKAPNNPDIQLGTGNFTIEFWVYLASGDTGSNRGLVAKGGASTGWLVSLNTTEKVVFTYTTSTITSSGSITTNAWNYIAVVREGTGSNQTKIYINGANDGTGTVSTDFNQTEVLYVGCNRAAGDPMKGFIDDLRITKGVARTITTPTAAFPDL